MGLLSQRINQTSSNDENYTNRRALMRKKRVTRLIRLRRRFAVCGSIQVKTHAASIGKGMGLLSQRINQTSSNDENYTNRRALTRMKRVTRLIRLRRRFAVCGSIQVKTHAASIGKGMGLLSQRINQTSTNDENYTKRRALTRTKRVTRLIRLQPRFAVFGPLHAQPHAASIGKGMGLLSQRINQTSSNDENYTNRRALTR